MLLLHLEQQFIDYDTAVVRGIIQPAHTTTQQVGPDVRLHNTPDHPSVALYLALKQHGYNPPGSLALDLNGDTITCLNDVGQTIAANMGWELIIVNPTSRTFVFQTTF